MKQTQTINILHLTHTFYPDRSGTAERIYFSQPQKQIQHLILKPGKENLVYQYENFIVHCIKLNVKRKNRLTTIYNARKVAKKAIELIKSYNVNVLYGHNPLLFSMATQIVKKKLPLIPLIYEPHNLLYSHYLRRTNNKHLLLSKYFLGKYHYFLVRLERKLFNHSDFIICQTEALSRKIVSLYKVNMSKIIIAYNGRPDININLTPWEIREKYQIPYDEFVIYGGDLSDNNGIDIIMDLIKQTPSINYIIAGKGKYGDSLSKLSLKLPNLRFLGILSKSDYLEVLSVSDTLLILRKKDLTNDVYLPLKILDAIELRKKVLTTKLQIMDEISQHYKDIYYSELKLTDLKQKLTMLIKGENINVNLETVRRNFNQFSWTNTQKNIAFAINSFKK